MLKQWLKRRKKEKEDRENLLIHTILDGMHIEDLKADTIHVENISVEKIK